ncbi:hypothetical protein GCM10010524_24270 [Streptomyces mexicanus]
MSSVVTLPSVVTLLLSPGTGCTFPANGALPPPALTRPLRLHGTDYPARPAACGRARADEPAPPGRTTARRAAGHTADPRRPARGPRASGSGFSVDGM